MKPDLATTEDFATAREEIDYLRHLAYEHPQIPRHLVHAAMGIAQIGCPYTLIHHIESTFEAVGIKRDISRCCIKEALDTGNTNLRLLKAKAVSELVNAALEYIH
jgi:hypothetical protein